MNKFVMMIAGIGIATAAVPAAAIAKPVQAQQWQNINQRQANLDRRIDQGIRNGALTRNEAKQLRGEYYRLAQLERNYRQTGQGLTRWERQDLDRRFDILSRKIRIERNDRQGGYRR